MPNLASILKDEIARIARKEVRAETDTLKKTSARYRSEIAELKRRVVTLEKLVQRAQKQVQRSASAVSGKPTKKVRFSAKGLRTHRERLGLSAADLATLLSVSQQTLYNWELGKTKPRASQLGTIAALRKMGKREVWERLS